MHEGCGGGSRVRGGCGGGVEGVRVGPPESSTGRATKSDQRGAKVASNDSREIVEDRPDVAAFASLPFPVDPLDPNASAAEIDKLQKAGMSVKSNWVPPGQHDRWGHAQILVRAPLEAARK